MKPVSDCPSKRSRIAPAFTFERLPCAASTWKDAPASERIVPTRNAPSSSKSTCFIPFPGFGGVSRSRLRPLDELGHMLRKRHERVVAATHDRMQRPLVESDRVAIVEHDVAGLHEEPVTLRPRDSARIERAQLVDVPARELEFLARVEVSLRTEVAKP